MTNSCLLLAPVNARASLRKLHFVQLEEAEHAAEVGRIRCKGGLGMRSLPRSILQPTGWILRRQRGLLGLHPPWLQFHLAALNYQAKLTRAGI